MSVEHGGLLVLAIVALAVVSGANDGASMLALAVTGRQLPPIRGLAILVAALVGMPLLIGAPVASTLADGLVGFAPSVRATALPTALLLGVGVAGALAWRGLPTSITLALVGSLVGLGLGLGAAVQWPVVARAGLIAAAAPIIAAAIARLLRAGVPRSDVRANPGARRLAGGLTFAAQAVAYGANDGQKVVALLVVGSTTSLAAARSANGLGAIPVDPTPHVAADAWLVVVAIAFALGTLGGLRAIVRSLGGGVVAVHPSDALTAQVASSVAVLGSAAWGMPVSMTQATAAGLVGSGLTRGPATVRWNAAARIAGSWFVTLPSSIALGAVVAVAWRAAT